MNLINGIHPARHMIHDRYESTSDKILYSRYLKVKAVASSCDKCKNTNHRIWTGTLEATLDKAISRVLTHFKVKGKILLKKNDA